MEPISAPAAVPEPEQPAPPTISGANGKAPEPITTATVEKALAALPPNNGVLDLDAMVASFRDGKWYQLSVGGRFRLRGTTIAAAMFRSDLEAAYRAANNLLTKDAEGKLPPIPPGDFMAMELKTIRSYRISDFDSFRLGSDPLPNRTPDGKLHMENIDLLLSLPPVQGALFAALGQANADANRAMQAEAGNSPTPSATN